MSQIITVKDPAHAKQLSDRLRRGELRRVHRGVYTDDMGSSLSNVVRKHWMDVVSYVVSSGVLTHRTGLELKPYQLTSELAIVYLTSTYRKTISLPGLKVKVLKGNNTDYLEQASLSISRSSLPRLLLENLTSVSSVEDKNIKTVGLEGVEKQLAKELRYHGEQHLNKIRDDAKKIADDLGYAREYKKLTNIICSLLQTNTDNDVLQTPDAQAVAKNQPYDQGRINLFENLCVYLKQCKFRLREYKYQKTTFRNIAFFESYFSNFIEGTEFLIDEAEDIVFSRKEIANRHADSHDVLANFVINNDFTEMCVTPNTADELIDIMQSRHSRIMKERHEKRPGEFKQKPNKAGSTYFVMPEDVIGTLCQGFKLYLTLSEGIERALFMHLLVSEVHPFVDGNGRMARIMMNAELVSAGLHKVIIPTVLRDNYLNGLRLSTKDQNFLIYCRTIDQAQAYVQSINWVDYGMARAKLETDRADALPDDGLAVFNRVLKEFLDSEFS